MIKVLDHRLASRISVVILQECWKSFVIECFRAACLCSARLSRCTNQPHSSKLFLYLVILFILTYFSPTWPYKSLLCQCVLPAFLYSCTHPALTGSSVQCQCPPLAYSGFSGLGHSLPWLDSHWLLTLVTSGLFNASNKFFLPGFSSKSLLPVCKPSCRGQLRGSSEPASPLFSHQLPSEVCNQPIYPHLVMRVLS